LEHDAELSVLADAVQAAAEDNGSVVLVSGEARGHRQVKPG
jgi:methylmalonyl-CoA mutase cobalamin-binding subunit